MYRDQIDCGFDDNTHMILMWLYFKPHPDPAWNQQPL